MTKCKAGGCEKCRPSSRGREKLNDIEIAKWWEKVRGQSGMLDYMLGPAVKDASRILLSRTK